MPKKSFKKKTWLFAVLTVLLIFILIVLFNQNALRKAYHNYKLSSDSEYIHQLLLEPEGSSGYLVLIDDSKKEEGRLTLVLTLLDYYILNKKKLHDALMDISNPSPTGTFQMTISFNSPAGNYVEFITRRGRIMTTMRTNFGPEPPERIQQIKKAIRLVGSETLKFKNGKYPKLEFSLKKGGSIRVVPADIPEGSK